MARVEIYVKGFCSYCYRAEKLLESNGAEFEAYTLDSAERRQEMIARANGRTTFPQVFIGARHVGGSDELHELERQGRLDGLLAAEE